MGRRSSGRYAPVRGGRRRVRSACCRPSQGTHPCPICVENTAWNAQCLDLARVAYRRWKNHLKKTRLMELVVQITRITQIPLILGIDFIPVTNSRMVGLRSISVICEICGSGYLRNLSESVKFTRLARYSISNIPKKATLSSVGVQFPISHFQFPISEVTTR